MLHEEIMKYVPEEMKKAVKNTYIDEYGYWIWFTDDYVVNTSGLDLQFYYMHDLTAHHVSYCFEHVRKVSESSEQEREEEEEEEEEEEPEELSENDVQTDTFNPDDCVITLGINLYLPCKSRTEYEDKCIEFTKNTLNDTYNALCQIAYIVGNSLGYNLTKTDVDVRYSTTSCSPSFFDDYHVRFLRSEMIIIQQALYYYASHHSLHNEHKLIFEYVSKLVNMAVLREYDSAVFHVDCDPSPDDELPF